MPTSTWRSITPILDIIMDLKPRPARVLDVGIGSGKYGFLCREYLHYWEDHLFNTSSEIVIDGIEVFPDYVDTLQREIYNHLFIADAMEILPRFKNDAYDLLILIDVLEHCDELTGLNLLQECQRVAQVVIVSTPRVFVHQPPKWGNPAEEHKSLWSAKTLKACGACWFTQAENQIAVFARGEYQAQFRPWFRRMRSFYYRLPLALQMRLSTDSKLVAPLYQMLARVA